MRHAQSGSGLLWYRLGQDSWYLHEPAPTEFNHVGWATDAFFVHAAQRVHANSAEPVVGRDGVGFIRLGVNRWVCGDRRSHFMSDAFVLQCAALVLLEL